MIAVPKPANAQRRYTVETIRIDAVVQPNGLMEIHEAITYDFRGSYTFAFRDFPRSGNTQVQEIAVSEPGLDYRRSGSNVPGTFNVTQESSSTRVTWYYRADNERRTFNVDYMIDGGVHRYPDTAELYYKFVGQDWDRPIGSVHATVRFARPQTTENLRAWAHGPLNGLVRIDPGGTVEFDVSPLPARRFWEGRILFPSAAVPALALTSNLARAEAVMNEERVWAEEANAQRARQAQRRRLAGWFLPISLGLVFVGLIFWVRAYQLHGRPHEVPMTTAPGEIPSDHPPAIVAYLLSRSSIGGPAVVATLLDLARRGYFEIHQTLETTRGFSGEKYKDDYLFQRTAKPVNQLESFERDLMEFLLHHSDSPDGFRMSTIKKVSGSPAPCFPEVVHGVDKGSEGARRDARVLRACLHCGDR